MRLYEVIPSIYDVRKDSPEEVDAKIGSLDRLRYKAKTGKGKGKSKWNRRHAKRSAADIGMRRREGDRWDVYTITLEKNPGLTSTASRNELWSALNKIIMHGSEVLDWNEGAILFALGELHHQNPGSPKADEPEGDQLWVAGFRDFIKQIEDASNMPDDLSAARKDGA